MGALKRGLLTSLWFCLSLAAAGALRSQDWSSRAGAGALAVGEAAGAAWPGMEGRASNPAQGGGADGLLLSHAFWVQDLTSDQAAVAWPALGATLGLQAVLETAQGLDQRDAAGRWLGETSLQQQFFDLDASRDWGGLSFGARAELGRLSVPGASADWGAGAGLAWNPGHWRFGLAGDGLGSGFTWRAGALYCDGPDLDRAVALGYLGDGPDARWGGGAQWRPWPMLALRLGWQRALSPLPGSLGQASAGLALNLTSGELAYTWLDEGDLGQVHRLQWSGGFSLTKPAPSPTPVPSPFPTATASPSPTATAVAVTPVPSPRPTATPAGTAPRRPVDLHFVIP